MSYKEFLTKMDEDKRCCFASPRNIESVCLHENAMDLVTFSYSCRGNLTDRPHWCPLKEVKDEHLTLLGRHELKAFERKE